MKFVLLITILGGALGTLGGMGLAHAFTKMFMRVYQYPELVFRVRPDTVAAAVLVAGGAAILGSLGAIVLAVRLPPAEAMRPEPPARFRPTFLERIGFGWLIPNVARMVLRQLERHPIKTILSMAAVAMSVAIVVVGNFMQDSIDKVIQSQFFDVQRYDLLVATVEPVEYDAVFELTNLPGVYDCEPMRIVSTRFRAGHRTRRVAIRGLSPDSDLMRLVDRVGHETRLPPDGLVISSMLADVLAVKAGDVLRVEVLQEKRPVLDIPIVALLDDISGLNAYMDIDALNRHMREGRRVNAAMLATDPLYRTAIYRDIKETPRIASVTVKEASLDSFRNTIAQNMSFMRMINLMFSIIIAAGVVYNGARISLSERTRELATLRVIGFTRTEISMILLGEIGTITLVAVPFGLVMGYFFAMLLSIFFQQEVFRFPFVIENSTYGLAASVVLTASIVSALIVRRRLDELDLIAVLKSRD
jgi:putative ABC transport system permease protein